MKIRFWINIFLFIFIILLSINIFTKKIEIEEEKSLTDINLNSINEIIIEVKMEIVIVGDNIQGWLTASMLCQNL